MQLISIYLQMGQTHQADALAKHLLNSNTIQPQMALQLAQHMAKNRRFAVVEIALKKYTTLAPTNPQGWTNLAALQLVLNKRGEMLASLQKAIDHGGEPVRNMIRKDKRFAPAHNSKEYQKLIPPIQKNRALELAPLGL